MAGFQRITELSSLGLKILNDQLEMLWKKVMGGISYNEKSGELKNVVDTLEDGNNIGSYFTQKNDDIRFAVGAVGENNLILNGDAKNGIKYWSVHSGALSVVTDTYELNREVFELNGNNVINFKQTSISCSPAVRYTFSFKGLLSYPAVNVTAYIRGKKDGTEDYYEHKQITLTPGANYQDYYISFDTYTDENELEAIFTAEMAEPYALFYVTDIQIKQGNALTSFCKNNSEQKTNIFSLNNEGIYANINAIKITGTDESGETSFVLKDESLKIKSVFANQISALGRGFLGDGVTIYVSISGSDDNDGTENSPLRSIQKAISFIPLINYKDIDIYISPGEYFEDVMIFGYSFLNLNIHANSVILNGRFKMFCSGNIFIQNMYIRTTDIAPCIYAQGAGLSVRIENCQLNKVNKKSYGVQSEYGAKVQIISSSIHNCSIAMLANETSCIYLYALSGKNNNIAFYCSGGFIMGAETYPTATTLKIEVGGGKVIYDNNIPLTSEPTVPSISTYNLISYVSDTGCYSEQGFESGDFIAKGSIKRHNDAFGELENGPQRAGLWFFEEGVFSYISQKTIYGSLFTVKRAKYGGDPGPVLIRFYLHNLLSKTSGIAPVFFGTGIKTKLAWGEEGKVFFPAEITQLLINETYKGIAIKIENENEDAAVFCPQSEYVATLKAYYR